MHTLIKNIKLVTTNNILHGYGVIVSNGKISNIDLEKNINPKNIDIVIDGNNKYLSPGFIDIHNHGNSGCDFMDSTEYALDKIGEYHLKNGVTSYLGSVLTSSYDNMKAAVKNIAQYKNKNNLSKILGVHLEGPFFSVSKKGAQPEQYIKEPDLNFIKEIIDIANNKIKMVSIAPERNNSCEIISFLKKNNITVAMAHSDATYDEAIKGINHGITVATHLFNGMRDFIHREPGLVGASLTDERVFCELIYDRIHIHDIAAQIAIQCKTPQKCILVSDAMRAAGLNDGIYELGGQKVIVENNAARLENKSLAGSTLNLKTAVYNIVNHLNMPIHEAVKMATLSPAKAIGECNKGIIEVGKYADLIMFDENIDISFVMTNGEIAINL